MEKNRAEKRVEVIENNEHNIEQRSRAEIFHKSQKVLDGNGAQYCGH